MALTMASDARASNCSTSVRGFEMLVPRFKLALEGKGNWWGNAPIIPHSFIALLAEAPTTSAQSYITLEAEV